MNITKTVPTHLQLRRIAVLDDYQNCVSGLQAYRLLDGHDVVCFHDSLQNEDALVSRLENFDAIVVLRERTALTENVLRRLPALRVISAAGTFPSTVNLEACRALGIAASQSAGTGAPTAELCWALVLASRRNLLQESEGLRVGLWQRHLGQQLHGHTLGIWGYGRVGRQVARYGQAFGMRVGVWGSDRALQEAAVDGLNIFDSREALFIESDVLSLHLKLVDRTRGIVTYDDLAMMKENALLVNTSRAELVASGALALALARGRPGFAAIDVFESEPVRAGLEPLLKLPNVLGTPHIGFVERDNFEAYYQQAFANLLRFEAGDTQGFLFHPACVL